jgi:indole-3-acetate O-methyltransferase
MEKIMEAVEQKYHAQLQNSPPLEFQVFFNDVTANDFNTLFKTLPSYQKYFAAGVPGTFYGRLFPKSTLHLAYSSYSLHWLSKVPQEVVDTKSPAWNKGSIQCSGTAKEVAKAYSAQFKTDMDNFLNARAQEIIGGGLMVIIIAGLPDGILMSQTVAGIFNDFFGSCLIDMAKSVSNNIWLGLLRAGG